jgi:hypothetical protein
LSGSRRGAAGVLWTATLALLLAWTTQAAAHFAAGAKVRGVVVAVEGDELLAYARVPAPLLFADAVVDAMETQTPFADPFVRAETLGPAIRHRLSLDALAADPEGFERRLAAALEWRQGGRRIDVEVRSWRVLLRDPQGGFLSAEEARAALAEDGARIDPVFGDAVVDMALALDAPALGADLTLRSALPPLPLPPDVRIDNHLRDERGTGTALVLEGQLEEPLTLEGRRTAALAAHAEEGARAALRPEHALLVLGLALGAGIALRPAIAFAGAQGAVLAASFLGGAPAAGWLAPAAGSAAGATVLLAAWMAWRRRPHAAWWLAALGAVQGLALSTRLWDLHAPDAPGAAAALVSFTAGAMLIQAALVAATLLAMRAIGRAQRPAEAAALAGIALVAVPWMVGRGLTLA